MKQKRMNRSRKVWSVLFAVFMIAVLLVACTGNNTGGDTSTAGNSGSSSGNAGSSSGTSGNGGASDAGNGEDAGHGVDLSKKVNLKMVLLGDPPTDLDLVLAELNKLIDRDLNAELEIEFLPWSDWQQKYPLILASGETVDLIYTSDWALYAQEAAKGAFVEVTDEIIQNYMPLTADLQDQVSLDQGRIGGKLYFVPRSSSAYTGESAVLIRGDLREKYGIPPLKSVDDLEAYFRAIAENEEGIFANAASQGSGVKGLTFGRPNNTVTVYTTTVGQGEFIYKYDGDNFNVDMVQYNYFMPEYAEWAKKMKSWAEAGFWSRNAAANRTEVRDAFENGTSASLQWNIGTLANSADKVMLENPSFQPEIYDVNPNSIKQMGLFTNDGMAVAYTSQNMERSFMLLDKLKFDRDYHELFVAGIEGTHWIAVGDDQFEPGPDFERYKYGANGTWGVNNVQFQRKNINENPIVKQMEEEWEPKTVFPITEWFKFDANNIRSELATLTSLEAKYGVLIDLGHVEDVDAAIAEFKDQAMKGGFEKIEAELKAQLQEFLDNR